MKNLNTVILSNLPIPKVSVSEQIRVIDYLSRIQTTVDEHTKQLAKLQSQKTGLMQDLLSGKVRVKVSEP
jgi:type I restriction enzyme S subunit